MEVIKRGWRSPPVPVILPYLSHRHLPVASISLVQPIRVMVAGPDSRVAGFPFDKLTANVILRSCDKTTFLVHSAILAEASPVFSDLFSLPGPSQSSDTSAKNEVIDGRPVVDVTEDSETLDTLLRFCYSSVPDPQLATLETVQSTLEGARKYQLEVALRSICQRLLDFAPEEPARVYAIACLFHLKTEALGAAKLHLGQEMLPKMCPELARISVIEHHNLLEYHQRCQVVAAEMTKNFRWIPEGVPPTSYGVLAGSASNVEWNTNKTPWWFACSQGACRDSRQVQVYQHNHLFYPTKWWFSFMEQASEALRQRPCGGALRSASFLEPFFQSIPPCKAHACTSHEALSQFKSFIRYFADAVDKKIAEVRFTSPLFFYLCNQK